MSDGKFLQRVNKILVTYHDLEPPLEKSGYGPVCMVIRVTKYKWLQLDVKDELYW